MQHADELKIVFTGPTGAGKTTAIRVVSDTPESGAGASMFGDAIGERLFSSVGFDLGVCQFDDGSELRLYGTPGQDRFRSMWEGLGLGAFGLVVLADNTRPDPIGDVERCLEAFASWVPLRRTVIGVGRLDTPDSPGIDAYCSRLASRGWLLPVIEVDVRRPADVRLLLSVLVGMAEVDGASDRA